MVGCELAGVTMLKPCTTTRLHKCTAARLHGCTATPLHYYTTTPLHHYTTYYTATTSALLHYYAGPDEADGLAAFRTTLLLHYMTAQLHDYTTTLLLVLDY